MDDTLQRDLARSDLDEQARHLREEFPDLFAYLARRDQRLLRMSRRVPTAADLEMSATYDYRSYLDRAIAELGPGVSELARD